LSDRAWSWRKKLLLIVGGALVLSSPIFIWLGLEGHKAHVAFIEFSDALIERNYERAYALASPDFRTAIEEPAFAAQQMELCARLGALKRVKSSVSEASVNQDGWSSTIAAHFIFEKGEILFEVVMKKRGDRWQLYKYRSL
jgi:hypothetical protein